MSKLSNALLIVFATSSASVFAADGTITINGRVLDSTCTLTSDGGSTQNKDNITVTLPAVKTSAFTAVGSVAGRTDFQLKIVDSSGKACDSLSGIKGVLISAATNKYLSTDPTALLNTKVIDTTPAENKDKKPVHVQILDQTQAINFKNPTAIKPDAEGVIKLASQYYQATEGSIAAQNVQAVVDYTLIYN
ncbi:fimbrial protein [Acinetobacter larvae]|uniref:Fimbrial-type adhesion domain-containing protein n=1 Tax=Acinetobacter larvae TaxID=1789224 RepID=A0A1B2LVP8_9GAMM|nr:fimbrial protein [Acinetobacter larvae]AOA57022.1 hypothetical protein BFG52_00715 [Acinetobacter larvae]